MNIIASVMVPVRGAPRGSVRTVAGSRAPITTAAGSFQWETMRR